MTSLSERSIGRIPHLGRWAALALVGAVLLHGAMFLLWPKAAPVGVDMNIYRAGGLAVWEGRALYQGPVTYQNLFTYPPISALVFVPLTVLPIIPLVVLTLLAHFALLVLVVRQCWLLLGYRADRTAWLVSVLVAGFALWLEPVWLTVALGQVNLLLMLLVLWDARSVRAGSRWQGVGIGLAAGFKLTPVIFIAFLLVTGRFRAAGTAVLTFLGTVALGFLVVPADAWQYWTSTFFNANRIGDLASSSNQSLAGTLARFAGTNQPASWPWLLAAGLAGIAGFAVAWQAHRRGETLLSWTVVGLTGCAVSPFSWEHHWVWFVPLLVFALNLVLTGERALGLPLLAGGYLLAFCWFTQWTPFGSSQEPGKGLFSWDSGPLQVLTRNVFMLIFVGALVLVTVHLRRESGKMPGLEPVPSRRLLS
ncbi:glycosyltransferase 87 family protein [Crossiella sp. SN42]|uniref:glycosyltransferase 87 family protein n=1 Tax=Crossiella sp. SN42 TaxID=2944808 RepID=UPI00207D4903|nr:glycosyltransferase 87 family protein [Crossiella sp. SN42]MCO1579872.1 glycosyltransferase 87 family protein [Crossiella sp. SN42]